MVSKLINKLFGTSKSITLENKSFPVSNLTNLTISVDMSDVEIIVHEHPRMDIEFQSYESGPELKVTQNDERFTILAKKERKSPIFIMGTIPKCLLKIYVPRDITKNWNISATSGAISANHLVANLFRVSATSGKINLNNIITEKIMVDTTSGNIFINEIKMHKLIFIANSGKVEVHTAYGDIKGKVGSGKVILTNIKGENLEVRAGSGRIHLEEVYMKDAIARANSGTIDAWKFWVDSVNVGVSSGKINLRDFRGKIIGNSNSGSIKVSISENTTLDLKSGSGNVYVEFQEFELNSTFDVKTGSGNVIMNLPIVLEQSGSHLSGKVGNGANLIRLRTGSGNAVLSRARAS